MPIMPRKQRKCWTQDPFGSLPMPSYPHLTIHLCLSGLWLWPSVSSGFLVTQQFVPSALFATGIVFMTYRLSLLLYKDCWIAFASAFVLLFPGMFVDASRRAMMDIPLAFFVTLAFFAVFKAKDQKPWYLVFGLASLVPY